NAATLSPDDRALFDSIELELPGGQWTCLLGESGVGKTTLLRLVAGLEFGAAFPAPDIQIQCGDGIALAGRAAYMAQQDLLLPWASVMENVMLGARLRGARGSAGPLRRRAAELLDKVGLAGTADDLPATLSGGMRQRAALVRTLIEDRPVVLMDEPFSALDAITRIKLQELAAELLRGKTVLLVTHDPMEAMRLGHHIHVLSGRPARLDKGQELTGVTPRSFDDRRVLDGQADLLRRLSDANTETGAK
ncbi:MAG: ATP-binding cassette domain-containing protein, partial [Rhodospirillales bacterium]|nr:ATP-binding cassette domain-containing protein [Rhodospirillales bacterium]